MKNRYNLLRYFLIKDIKARYAGSALGILWSFMLPIFQIMIYWFVFSNIMKARPYSDSQIPYIFFLLSGFFFWTAFAESISRASVCIIENSELVKKVPFNNIVLPLCMTLSSYFHNMIGLLVFLIIYSASGYLTINMLFFIPILICQIIFSIGLGMLISSIVPYIRDLQQIMGYVLQGMFFLSPIIYPMQAIPEKFRWLLYLNPITIFIESYHKSILNNSIPNVKEIALIFFICTLTLMIGIKTFNKLKEGFADIL